MHVEGRKIEMRERNESNAAARRRAAVIGVIALVSLALAVVSALGARSARREASRSGASADAIELIEIRSALRLVHLHETNEAMLVLLDVSEPTSLEAARDARISLRSSALQQLEVLSRGSGTVASEALALADVLRSDGLTDVREADPVTLFSTSRSSIYDGRTPDELQSDEDLALYDLARTDAVASQILNDALDAAYTLEAPTPDDLMAEYVSESEPYIRSDGGYLGPDRNDPLIDSYVYDAVAATPHPALASITDRLIDSDLWEYDQWVRSWQNGTPGPAPMPLADLAEQVRFVEADLVDIVGDATATAKIGHERDARSAERRFVVLTGLAIVFGLLCLVLAAVATRRRSRALSHVAARATVDPLTGVGNRHRLELETAPRVADTSFGWHLLAAIDMDRFKMINDTWGHAVGDAVLIEVARKLETVVAGWRGGDAGIAGSVVRLGGDEFLLTLHAKTPINEAIVREQLEEIRGSSIESPDGEDVQLSFSLGVAIAVGSAELDDLMRAADLAAYEEKAQRRAGMPDRRSASTSELSSSEPRIEHA
jgi:diguanylate cyclase